MYIQVLFYNFGIIFQQGLQMIHVLYYYDDNKNILVNALGSSACTVEAHANYEGFNCTYGNLSIGINQKGYATVREGTNKCSVYGDGTSICQ